MESWKLSILNSTDIRSNLCSITEPDYIKLRKREIK